MTERVSTAPKTHTPSVHRHHRNTVSFDGEEDSLKIFGNKQEDLHSMFLLAAEMLLIKDTDTEAADASHKNQYIINTKELGPFLLRKLEELTKTRRDAGIGEPTLFENNTLSWVTELQQPDCPSNELVANLLTFVAKTLSESGSSDGTATREFITYLLHGVFTYDKGEKHYKKFLQHKSLEESILSKEGLLSRLQAIKKKETTSTSLWRQKSCWKPYLAASMLTE